MRTVGTVVRGIRCPVIREGDDLRAIVADSVMMASEAEGFPFHDKDVVSVTEAVVARAQGNYANIKDIAADVRAKFGGGALGVVFPILSRNRIAVALRGIAMGADKIVLQLSYPSDEVGNPLFPEELLEEKGVNPWTDVLTEADYRRLFGAPLHPFTGVDYVAYYKELIENAGAKAEIIFANSPKAILDYAENVLACDVHTRERTCAALKKAGAKTVLSLADIMNASVNGSGYNESFGLLGFNKVSEETIKLFPRDCQHFVDDVQAMLRERTGKHIEVMVYGDGAFKDPRHKIWELHDPVVSPAYTAGLSGLPNELKLKYLADSRFSNLKGAELDEAIRRSISEKSGSLMGSMDSEGTTPRHITDLLGSLCDLTSGSGDKGTPIVLVQGYFDSYAD